MAYSVRTDTGFARIEPHEKGFKQRLSSQEGPLEPGLYYCFPWERMYIVNMTPLSFEEDVEAKTSDNFPLKFTLHVRFRPYDARKVIQNAPENLEEKMRFLSILQY